MIYNTIMVQLDVEALAAPRLAFAWDLAQRFEADLIAFAAAEAFPLMPADIGGASVEVTRAETYEITDRLHALKSEFDELIGDSDKASWRSVIGDPARFLALNARAADLLIVGSDDRDTRRRLRTIDPGGIVLSAGRPVLFATDGFRPMTADNVLVAWKDTCEARRAVVDAMPFLTDARQVVVATVVGDDTREARESAADVVRFLMKHGIKVRSDMLAAGMANTADALVAAAAQIEADLIVSGGYGHSRLREWAFGGVTRSLLANSAVNRLIAS
jgi:nucleotide-binding universal stress UspA family protein